VTGRCQHHQPSRYSDDCRAVTASCEHSSPCTGRTRCGVPRTCQRIVSRAVELGFKRPRFFQVFKNLKTSKAQFMFLCFFIMCNLINKPHVQILIVICEIHQFHLHCSHGVLRSLEICL